MRVMLQHQTLKHTGWFMFEGRGWRPYMIHLERRKSDREKMNISAVTLFYNKKNSLNLDKYRMDRQIFFPTH